MRKVTACFYPQNIRRAARKFLSAQGASPQQWVNTSVRVLCLKSIWRFDRQWERLQRVFTLRISGAPPESSFPLKARRPNSGWTLLYAFYAWNLSDGSIGNEKGYSVFLPSEYQARRPKVPFRSRRVAPTVGEHFCTRFMLEIYLTVRSAMRKVTACFYPQNIRRAARKFLSVKARRPNSGWTLMYVLYLKSIWRFDRQWERLQRVFTLRISGAPPESSFPFKARRPNSGWTLLYVVYLKSDGSIGNEKGYSVFLPSEYQARRPKVPFRSRRVARTVGEHFCTFYTWNLSDGSIGNEKGCSVFLPSEYQARRPKVPFRSRRVAPTVGEHFCTLYTWNLSDASIGNKKGHSVFLPSENQAPESSFPFKARRTNSGRTLPYVLYSEIYLTPNNFIDVITIATIFQIIRIGGRSVMQTTRIFS